MLTWCNSFAWKDIDAQPPLVQVLDVDLAARESRDQLDLAVVEKVVPAPGEAGVRLLLDLEDDITGLDTGRLVTFAGIGDLLAAFDAAVDVDVKHLALDDGLLSLANLAAILVLNNLALAVAVGADSLESLNHGSHLPHHRLHAVAVAASALPDGALLAAHSFTGLADYRPLQRQLRRLTAVDILKGNLVGVVNCPRLGGSALTRAAAEHAA